jgi:hypothetical protein
MHGDNQLDNEVFESNCKLFFSSYQFLLFSLQFTSTLFFGDIAQANSRGLTG